MTSLLELFLFDTYQRPRIFRDPFKGYLHYKTITSQNVLSEAQVKTFLFCKRVMFHSQDIQDFVFLTIT